MFPEEIRDFICELKITYGLNHNLPQPYHTIVSALYSSISVFAFVCNTLLLVILHSRNKNKPRIRGGFTSIPACITQQEGSRRIKLSEKTRDHLIGYLAMFDLLLSLTMPLTALDVLTKYWPLGPNTEFIAQLTRAVPTALVYSSSMIITLIAINCYRQIINSSERQMTPSIIRYLLIPVTTISILITSPIFYFTKLDPAILNEFKEMGVDLNRNSMSENLESHPGRIEVLSDTLTTASTLTISTTTIGGIDLPKCKEFNNVNLSYISFVADDWTIGDALLQKSRLCYSIFSLFTQLIIPFVVISVCYYGVSKQLQKQTEIQRRTIRTNQRLRKEIERNKRRNKLLVTISLLYLITWLPLGIFGTLSDANIGFFGDDPKTIGVVFVTCHLIGMSSACANPLIYGFRNKHIRQGNITDVII